MFVLSLTALLKWNGQHVQQCELSNLTEMLIVSLSPLISFIIKDFNGVFVSNKIFL